MKFVAAYTAYSLLVILIAAGHTADHQSEKGHSSAIERNYAATNIYSNFSDSDLVDEVEEESESELELKRMLLYVTPLMGIFQKKTSESTRLNKRSPKEPSYEGRKRGAGRRPSPMYNQYNKYSEEMQPDRSGYGGYSSSSSYGGGSSYGGSSYGCCDKKDDLLPILALLALSLLLLYLIAIATTTVAGRRRRRNVATDSNNNDLIDEDFQSDIGMHHYVRIVFKLMSIDYGIRDINVNNSLVVFLLTPSF
jgi:hypothetical protein